MNNKEPSSRAEPDGAQTRCDTNPRYRILVVDDDDCIRQFNTEVLTHSGYQVDAAEDGAAAWNNLQCKSYDLLITDNRMPKVSGVELLRKLHAARMTLPVIMVSGTLPTEEFTRCPWLQPAATLLKPFTALQLLETVEKVLHATESIREQSESIEISTPTSQATVYGCDVRGKHPTVDPVIASAVSQTIINPVKPIRR